MDVVQLCLAPGTRLVELIMDFTSTGWYPSTMGCFHFHAVWSQRMASTDNISFLPSSIFVLF